MVAPTQERKRERERERERDGGRKRERGREITFLTARRLFKKKN